ncbi:unnamed protein product [Lota lota]
MIHCQFGSEFDSSSPFRLPCRAESGQTTTLGSHSILSRDSAKPCASRVIPTSCTQGLKCSTVFVCRRGGLLHLHDRADGDEPRFLTAVQFKHRPGHVEMWRRAPTVIHQGAARQRQRTPPV